MNKMGVFSRIYWWITPFSKGHRIGEGGAKSGRYPETRSSTAGGAGRCFMVPRRFQWYIAEGMLSLPTAKWSMVISFFSGVMASGFAFGCAKDTVEFFNAGIGEVRFPVGEGFLLVIFDYVGPWV